MKTLSPVALPLLAASAFATLAVACHAHPSSPSGVLSSAASVAARGAAGDSAEVAAARKALWAGVEEIGSPGLIGAVSAFGERAFPLAAGSVGGGKSKTLAACVAAAFTPKGRVVAFGHDGFFGQPAFKVGQTGRFVQNAVRWVRSGAGPVGVLAGEQNAGVVALLREAGIEAKPVAGGDDWGKMSALVVNGHKLAAGDEARLKALIERGGGLVMATTGWGWNYSTPGLTLARDYAGNRLLAPYGLAWSEGTMDGRKRGDVPTFPREELPALLNGARAMDAVTQSLQAPGTLQDADLALASRTLQDLYSGLPTGAPFAQRFQVLVAGAGGEPVIPSPEAPITVSQPAVRLQYLLRTRSASTDAAGIKADPAAKTFPGEVPADAKVVTKTVDVDLSVPRWHSTGLYAAPGAVVTVQLPEGAQAKGLEVRIGSHTDSLANLDKWERSPEISRLFPLRAPSTQVASAFGGLVYVVVPEGLAGRAQVAIGGAVEAPLFVLGQTSVADWKARVRSAPGPWAELASERVIITVPSKNVRDIDDPSQVLGLYNRAFEAMADLRGIKSLNTSPERIVADQQISAGYMHSGYPVMTWLDVQKKSVDYGLLMQESWGHWHEFGHNHQVGDWTFGGTGEVTNNLFALYVWETVIGKPEAQAHPALTPESFAREWAKYDAGGRKFEDWQSNPFLALHMYLQVKHAFGWEPFKKAFREYAALPQAQRPQGDEAKRDQWLVRFSRAVGRDLGPFFQAWGVPTSQAARDQVKGLPAWRPTTEQSLGTPITARP